MDSSSQGSTVDISEVSAEHKLRVSQRTKTKPDLANCDGLSGQLRYLLDNMDVTQTALTNLLSQAPLVSFHDRPKIQELMQEEIDAISDLIADWDATVYGNEVPQALKERKDSSDRAYRKFTKNYTTWTEEIKEGKNNFFFFPFLSFYVFFLLFLFFPPAASLSISVFFLFPFLSFYVFLFFHRTGFECFSFVFSFFLFNFFSSKRNRPRTSQRFA